MKNLNNTLNTISVKYKDIEKSLLKQDELDKDSLIKLNKEYAELTPLIEKSVTYKTPELQKNRLPLFFSIMVIGTCGRSPGV